MAADADARALGAGDHHGRVPAGRVEDLALDLLVAGEERLVLGGDGVDVVRAAHLGHGDALLAGPLDQPEHEVAGPLPAALVDGGVERVEPLLGLLGIEVRDLAGKAANDDRVAIGSGSHAVPSLFGGLSAAVDVLLLVSHRLHRVPRGGIRHLYREVTPVRGRAARSGRVAAKSQPYAQAVDAFRTAVRSRVAYSDRAQNAAKRAEWCGVTSLRSGIGVPGVAGRRPGSSPFRRSGRPGTCAIRPARVDYGQCLAYARGCKHIPKHDQEATRERDRGPRGGADQPCRQAGVPARAGGPGDRLRRRRRPGAPRGHRGSHRPASSSTRTTTTSPTPWCCGSATTTAT